MGNCIEQSMAHMTNHRKLHRCCEGEELRALTERMAERDEAFLNALRYVKKFVK
jgi:hypothetical protein